MSQTNDESTIHSLANERLLCFSLGGDLFAVPLSDVKEVIGDVPLTQIPDSPAHFRGIANLRGTIIPVMDLRLKLRTKKTDTKNETAIVIVHLQNELLGIIVDAVNFVLTPRSAEISAPPRLATASGKSPLIGVARKDQMLIQILNIAAALDVKEVELIKNQKSNKSGVAA